MIKTTAMRVRHALSTFLSRPLHDYDMKPPKDVDIRRRIFLPSFFSIKFERTQIHFFSDVFTAVDIVFA